MSTEESFVRVVLTRRYNLGNYEHAEGTIEISRSGVVDSDVEAAIARLQDIARRRLAREHVVAAASVAVSVPQQSPTPPSSPPPPVPDEPQPAFDAEALRRRIKAALAADPALIPRVRAVLNSRGARGLQSASDDVLVAVAEEIGITPMEGGDDH